MPKNYTTVGLIAEVKRRISIPTTQQLYTTDDFLGTCNDELTNLIFPTLLNAQQQYAVVYKDLDLIANQDAYPIPSDAYNGKLREVHLYQTSPIQLINLPQLSLEQIGGYGLNGNNSSITGYYVQNDSVKVFPTPTSANLGKLRLYYFKNPNYLVDVTEAGQILTINADTNEVTISNVPSTWTDGTNICVINQNPPFNSVISETPILTISAPTIGLASVAGLKVGDWMCLDGDSVIPQLPAPAFGILAQAAAVKVLESLGNQEFIQPSQAKLKEIMDAWIKSLAARVEGEPIKVTGNGNALYDWNGSSPQSGYSNNGPY